MPTFAQDRLSPSTLKKIQAIIGKEDDLASIANWADQIRLSQSETAPWHFIDLPIRQDVTRADVQNFCPNNDCSINQIQIDKGVLTDASQIQREKFRALRFIVHFVGDLHQPLHSSDDSDRGGNDKMIRFLKKKMKLHALWDHLIEKQTTEDSRDLATKLESGITAEKAKSWLQGDETDWALESYKIAKETIYKGYQPGLQDMTDTNLGNPYFKQMRPIVDEQLQKAGVRLAAILEDVFGDH